MTVRCDQCGHENEPQYHFCGMCGSPLRSAAVSPAPPRGASPPAASVPSFLGLAEEPKRDVRYLLEDDDEPRSHKGLYLVVVLLLVLGGGAAWYRWHETWPWEARRGTDESAASSQATPTPAATVTPSQSASSSQMATPSAPPSGSSEPVAPPAAANQAVVPAPPPSEKQEAVPEPTTTPSGANSNDTAVSQSAATPDTSSPAAGAATETPPTAVPAPEEKVNAASPPPKTHLPKARPAVAPVSAQDKLVSDGEKYLYGTGVPQNCERAQKNLLAAARQEDPKAYTLLGAMYATGHCVTRDLPSAYRWFARALHQDPGNTRLQQNLEVIWKQMTPEERKAATSGE